MYRVKNEMKLRMLRTLVVELCDQVEIIRATALERTARFARPYSQKWNLRGEWPSGPA